VLLSAALLCGCASEEDRAFYAAMQALPTGATETEVHAKLGTPAGTGIVFRLGQREGFEDEYAKAASSGSVRYLFWDRGIDVVCTIGLDKHDRVAYKGCGGT
jgi:hypothetical protein